MALRLREEERHGLFGRGWRVAGVEDVEGFGVDVAYPVPVVGLHRGGAGGEGGVLVEEVPQRPVELVIRICCRARCGDCVFSGEQEDGGGLPVEDLRGFVEAVCPFDGHGQGQAFRVWHGGDGHRRADASDGVFLEVQDRPGGQAAVEGGEEATLVGDGPRGQPACLWRDRWSMRVS